MPSEQRLLSPHFSLREMTATQVRGVPNEPDPDQLENLVRTCLLVMEPIRERFGPIYVTSGFRAPVVNLIVGGSKTSAHMDGRACDFVPLAEGVELREIVEWVAHSELPFDQLIYEYADWVHVGIARQGVAPRRQVLQKLTGRPFEPYQRAA